MVKVYSNLGGSWCGVSGIGLGILDFGLFSCRLSANVCFVGAARGSGGGGVALKPA